MRVLLTGAAGFIGSTIADVLLARGDEVVGLDVLLPTAHRRGEAEWGPPNLVVGDVRDADTVRSLLSGVDVVCHQAAMVGLGVDLADLPDYVSHNVFGTSVLLAQMAAAGVHNIVQASSMVVYGEGAYDCTEHGSVRPGPRTAEQLAAGRFDPPCPQCGRPVRWRTVREDARLDPRNAYAISKVAQEQLSAAWAHRLGGTAISLRYHNVYGPRMPRDTPYAGVAAIFRSALESGLPPRVLEDGRQMRDFVHVADVVRANLLAIDLAVRQPGGRPEVLACNVVSGSPHTVGELAAELSNVMGGPAPLVMGGGRPGDVRHVVGDATLAADRLGFTASVEFTAGVTEFATARMRASAGLG